MFGGNQIKNDSKIGSNSNGNTVFQGNQLSNPVFMMGTDNDMLDFAAQIGRYDVVQNKIASMMATVKRNHPLYPVFSADYNSKLGRLVSTPETAEAFREHPKKIKGTYLIDYAKYPHMDKSETPWEYAYRTQTIVEMDTTSYKEYLGDIEDPFPVFTYSEGMKTFIRAPEFPDAVDAIAISGDISIPFQLRRLPCMEYGWLVFGNISENQGFDIRIKTNEAINKSTISFTKIQSAGLEIQLLREKLFQMMVSTRKLRIVVSGKDLLSMSLSEQDVAMDMFAAAEPLSNHIERLISIEQFTGCRFGPCLDSVSAEDYHTTRMLAASIKGEWYITRGKYDEGVRADYDKISDDLLADPDSEKFSSESTVIRLSLYGQLFTADKSYAMYSDARISNFGTVKRAVSKKRNDIRIIIKPKVGKDSFLKYVRFDGLRLLTELEE